MKYNKVALILPHNLDIILGNTTNLIARVSPLERKWKRWINLKKMP